MCDLRFYNARSFVIMTPESDAGREWIFNNIFGDEFEAIPDCMWPVHIEHRYLEDIVVGARADGLVCEG